MPSSPPKPTLHLLPPPNPSVLTLTIKGPAELNPPAVHMPQPFLDALSIRIPVFVIEQKCPIEGEIDNDDVISWHWVIYAPPSNSDKTDEKEDGETKGDEEKTAAATIRLIPSRHDAPPAPSFPGFEDPDISKSTVWDQKEPYVTIGRLATLMEFRGRGYAKLLMEEALRFAGEHGGEMVVEKDRGRDGAGEWKGLVQVHAQARLEGWYRGLGFEGDEGMGRWVEGGIEHLGMWRRVRVGG